MSTTSIEWTATQRPDGTWEPGQTWNPVSGCTRVSDGCNECYAVRTTQRLEAYGQEKYTGLVNKGKKHFNGTVRCHTGDLLIPLRRRKATVWFVNSMSDLFHKEVPFAFIDQVLAVVAMCPQHRFLVLTKRAARMEEYFAAGELEVKVRWAAAAISPDLKGDLRDCFDIGATRWPLPNLGLLVSVEDQPTAEERIPPLLRTPAAMRGVSAEPLIAPVDFTKLSVSDMATVIDRKSEYGLDFPNVLCKGKSGNLNSLSGWVFYAHGKFGPVRAINQLDWVIVGGESGMTAANLRPLHSSWAQRIRDDCRRRLVAFFFKQWGFWWPIDQIPQDRYKALYVPRRPGKVSELGEEHCRAVYGERCTVPQVVVNYDGQRVNYAQGVGINCSGLSMTCMGVGKSKSGRLLDGREHNDRPADFFAP